MQCKYNSLNTDSMSEEPLPIIRNAETGSQVSEPSNLHILSPLGLAYQNPKPIQPFSLESINERVLQSQTRERAPSPPDYEENPSIRDRTTKCSPDFHFKSGKSASSANLLASIADNKTTSPSYQEEVENGAKKLAKDLFPKSQVQGSEKSVSRSRSVDKASTKSVMQNNILDSSPVLDHQFGSANKTLKDHSVFLDGEQPIIRTRVLTRGSDKSRIPLLMDDPEERSTQLRSNSRRELQEARDLGDILQQFVQAEESLSLTAPDEDMEDYDRMSEDVRRQMSQIRDEIVVDIDPDDEHARAAHEAQVARAANQPGEEQSIFKRVSYYASVAASAGFLLLMRRHNVL